MKKLYKVYFEDGLKFTYMIAKHGDDAMQAVMILFNVSIVQIDRCEIVDHCPIAELTPPDAEIVLTQWRK